MTTFQHSTDRRGFLVVGAAAAGAALLAACGKSSDKGSTGATTTTVALSARDALTLKTTSSIVELEAAVYQRAIDGNVFKSAGTAATAKLLLAQHQAHATLLEGETTKAGAQPFTQPNPALMQQYKPRIDGMGDEASFLKLAFDLSQQSSATCMAAVGNVDDANLNVVLASIGGVEARHVALIGQMINQQVPTGSFASTAGVAPGTGVQ